MTKLAAVRGVTEAEGSRVTVTLGFRTPRQSRAFYLALRAAQNEGGSVGLVVLARRAVEETPDERQ